MKRFRAAESESRGVRAAIGNLESIRIWVTGECRRLLRLSGEWARSLEDLKRNQDASNTERRLLNEAVFEAESLQARLEDLRALIRREGLDGLDAKIAVLETRRSELESKRGDLQEDPSSFSENRHPPNWSGWRDSNPQPAHK